MSNIVENVFFSFDMPSDLWRKRVNNFESKFKSTFLFACFAVYHVSCISYYCYHDLVK